MIAAAAQAAAVAGIADGAAGYAKSEEDGFIRAVSMTKCKKCSMMLLEIESLRGKHLCWATEAHRFAWPGVQLPGNGIELRLSVPAQVSPFGQVLSQQSVGVFVDAPLPRAMRIGKVHLYETGTRSGGAGAGHVPYGQKTGSY